MSFNRLFVHRFSKNKEDASKLVGHGQTAFPVRFFAVYYLERGRSALFSIRIPAICKPAAAGYSAFSGGFDPVSVLGGATMQVAPENLVVVANVVKPYRAGNVADRGAFLF